MLGILIVLLAFSSVGGASYKMGAVLNGPQDATKTEENQQQYNMSLVVVAIAFMLALCGLLMAQTGWNPFSSMNGPRQQAGGLGGLGF
jgi:NADH:ubiquinone oxidoreductase subunit 2 (subunit N)